MKEKKKERKNERERKKQTNKKRDREKEKKIIQNQLKGTCLIRFQATGWQFEQVMGKAHGTEMQLF